MDPDVDLRAPDKGSQAPILAAIAAGGVGGALARHGIGVAWPHQPDGFPWATWTINVTGSFLIGVLMVLIVRRWPKRRLIRPFFGVGVLGGYTTFSTAMVDVQQAAAHGAPGMALLYLAATLVGALVAVWAATVLTEAVAPR